ncbi:MAG TPA: hypothetical protein VJA66_06675 [Thermoanaerobaculia bacterium]
MKLAARILGVFVAVVGLLGVVAPDRLQAISRYTLTPLGLTAVGTFRIVFGIVLVLAARGSRGPTWLRFVGFVAVVAGVVTLFLDVDRARAILEWWSNQGPALMRLWPGLALVLGFSVASAAAPAYRPVRRR